MIGRQVSHFYILRTLGSGGMGIVYEAQDTRLPRSVAVKFLKPALLNSQDALKRFKREARLASSLNHPNICTVLEVDETDAQSFIVMELLQGRSLKARLAAGPLPLGELLAIAQQVAHALAAAHDQGIIHRDITPGNIFLTDSGLVKLLDFGLAKYVPNADDDAESTDALTGPGAVAGTIHYMAPERLVDDPTVDYRCDLFSLGAVLYEMAAGAPPFDLAPRSALISMIRHQTQVPLRQLAPHQPIALERIVARLLEKLPDQRYQSAREVTVDLLTCDPGAPHTPTVTRDTARLTAASVAVLPFEPIGGDRQLGRFRDGLAEDISGLLSASPGLRVAPRTSTRHLAGRTLREIGARLGVELILEGSIQLAAGRVRVAANLVDAASERPLQPTWRVDRPFDDSLSLQDDVARDICGGVAAAVVRASREDDMPEPEAHHAYQRGQHHWRACFSGGWRVAIEHFEYAIDRSPRFGLAHVALASAYNFCGFYNLIKSGLSFSVAARAAERALAIDGTLVAAHRELAVAKFGGEWDWEGAEEGFRRALAFDGTDALTHVYYSWLLILLGRDDAARAEGQKAQGLAPTSRLVTASRAQTLYIGGDYDEAIELCNACLRRDATYVFALQLRGLCHLARTARDEALADLEEAVALSHRAPFYIGLLGRGYGQFGMRAQALALVEELERLSRQVYVPAQCFVFIYAGLGDQDRALAFQEATYVDGASPFNYLTPAMRGFYARVPYHKRRLEQMRLRL